MFLKFFFRANFVEGDLAGNDTFAGVSDAAALENFLKVAIFAKGPVDRIERQIDVVRQLEILIPHIDFHDFGA
jgi:hypothetical protein